MYLFLDTNIYIGLQFDFYNPKLNFISKMVKNGEIKLLYTSVTEIEVIKHIPDLKTIISKYNSAVDSLSLLKKHEEISISNINKKDVIEFYINEFRRFLDKNNAIKIPLNKIDIEAIMIQYENNTLPFEQNKPNEFKDAFIVNGLKQYSNICNDKVHVISKDKGFSNSFLECKNINTYVSLYDFLQVYYASDNIIYSRIKEYLNNNGEFNKRIEEKIDQCDFDFEYDEWDLEAHNTQEVKIDSIYFEYEDKKKLRMRVMALLNIKIDVEVSFRDDDMSIYDSEERDYLYIHQVINREVHLVQKEISIIMDKEINDIDISFKIHMYEDLDELNYIQLDDETRISCECLSEKEEESKYAKCTNCGTYIDGDDIRLTYNDEIICEKCCQNDNKGTICTKCGKKIPHEHMVADFCDRCTEDEL